MDGLAWSIVASLMFMLAFTVRVSCSSTDSPSFLYEEYCHDILKDPEEESQHDTSTPPTSSDHLRFHRGFFSGGSPLFDTNTTVFSLRRPSNMAIFSIQSVTEDTQKYLVDASILLQNKSHLWSMDGFNRTRVFRQAGTKRNPFFRSGGMRVALKGFWNARSGTLCMAGCFIQNVLGQTQNRNDCQVKAVFHYPSQNTINQPLVKGMVESKRAKSDPLFFEPVSIMAVPEAPYVFQKDDENHGLCASPHANVPENIHVWKDNMAVCEFPWYKQTLPVVWNKQCTGQDCGPFEGVVLASQATLSVQNMACSGGKVHGYFIFNFQANKYQVKSEVFSIEGVWDALSGQLCASACYLKGATNGSLAFEANDCDIIITLQFPITLSLFLRYSVTGRVERKGGSKFSSFKPFAFTGHMDITYGAFGWGRSPPQLEYSYTPERISQARTQCSSSQSKKSKRKSKYPDGHVFSDLGFPATLKDSSGSSVEAYFSPIAINTRTNMYFNPGMTVVTSSATRRQKFGSMNISFDLSLYQSSENHFKLLQNTTIPARFPAEGVYNSKTGMLCLIVCRTLVLTKAQGVTQLQLQGGDKDCEMLVTIQYPSTNPGYFETHRISGEILSLREESDSLFFSRVSVLSDSIIYQEQAENSLVQIDLEIIMGIISLTMAVLFIGIQLRHVRKNPKVLPQISLLMLIVLTLGHLIPLILNFEAIFSSKSRQNVLQWSGGWLEINEVIVRLMTMLVFLLLICLLHLSWVSKCEASASEGPWKMERTVMRVCLTTYALGGLIAMIVYGIKGSKFLDVTKAFAGFTVDFFLLPQIVGNYVWAIQSTVLSFPFYMGMALVRSLPHLYDIVRRFEFFSLTSRRFYYANPSWDFYSNAWDIIIPCGNLLFAILVLCQQRYGGTCFAIWSWMKRGSYEKVSTNPL